MMASEINKDKLKKLDEKDIKKQRILDEFVFLPFWYSIFYYY
jgi:hypothetical protein